MLREQKAITIRCDMGSCDLTAKYLTEPEVSIEMTLYKEGWTVCKPHNQIRYICSSCYQAQLNEANKLIED